MTAPWRTVLLAAVMAVVAVAAVAAVAAAVLVTLDTDPGPARP